MKNSFVLFLLLLFLFFSCAQQRKSDNKISNKAALRIAIENFPENEFGKISDYSISVSSEAYEAGGWIITFYKRGKAQVGEDVTVSVDAKSGKVKIEHGE